MQKFSSRLKSLRKERNISQKNLAKLINKKRSTISGYETEDKEPDLDTICWFATYFGVSTDYLLGKSDERNHIEQVFFGDDSGNFERNFKSTSQELRPIIAQCFQNFYLLIGHDMQLSHSKHIIIYQELLYTLQSLRTEICKAVEASGGSNADAVAISKLMSLQSQLKNSIADYLDQLMQDDIISSINNQ